MTAPNDPSSLFLTKEESAEIHLEEACSIFLRNGHMALAITLAGIAEEIYASKLEHKHGPGQRFVDGIVALGISPSGTGPADFESIKRFLYKTKNGLKHANFEGEIVEVSPAVMAYTVGGALIHRRRLGLAYTPQMTAAFDRICREWL